MLATSLCWRHQDGDRFQICHQHLKHITQTFRLLHLSPTELSVEDRSKKIENNLLKIENDEWKAIKNRDLFIHMFYA